MFEVFGSLGSESPGNALEETSSFFEGKTYTVHEISEDFFRLTGYSRGEDGSLFENENNVLVVLGHVYRRLEFFTTEEPGPIFAETLLKEYLEAPDFYKRIKGNFTLFIYSKKNKELRIINDPFALKPVYYGFINAHFYFTNNCSLDIIIKQ